MGNNIYTSTENEKSQAVALPSIGFTFTVGILCALIVAAGSVANDAIFMPSPIVYIFTTLCSSGFGFVLIALVTGWLSRSWKVAAFSSTFCILLALGIYYTAIPILHLRPGAGGAEILKIALVWSVLGVFCGIIVGSLSFFAHHGSRNIRSLATGFPLGLILGTAVFILPQWSEMHDSATKLVVVLTIMIPALGILLSLRRTNIPRLLFSTLLGTIISGLLFTALYQIFY